MYWMLAVILFNTPLHFKHMMESSIYQIRHQYPDKGLERHLFKSLQSLQHSHGTIRHRSSSI